MKYSFRDIDPEVSADSKYNARIMRCLSIDEIPWKELSKRTGEQFRIIVQATPEVLPLDMLYAPKEHKELLVGLHGAIDRKSMSAPVFQFLRSFKATREESYLLIADSTILPDAGVRLGWYFGSTDFDITQAYIDVLRKLREDLSLERIVVCGHSAGGFSAARVGLGVEDSLSVVVNAQFDLAWHRQWDITRLREMVDPEIQSNEKFLAKYWSRTSLQPSLLGRKQGAKVAWYAHADDHLSFGEHPHFDLFEQASFAFSKSFPLLDLDVGVIVRYANPKGDAHGLPGTFAPFLEHAFGETVSIDLGAMRRRTNE